MTRRTARLTTLGATVTGAMLWPIASSAQIQAAPGQTFAAPARSITISVSNDLLYDTNVARGSDDAAALRGVKKEDVRTTASADVDLVLPSGGATFTLAGAIGYTAYARNERLDRERIDLTGGADLPVAFCRLAPRARFARWQTALEDLSIDLPAARSTENVQTTASGEAALSCGPEIGLRSAAFISYADTKNSALTRRAQNVQTLGYGAGLSYANPSVGLITLFAARRDFTYDSRQDAGLPLPLEFSVTRAGVKVDRRLGTRLQLVASISHADTRLPAGIRAGRDLDGVNWSLAATLRIGERLLFVLESERAIDSSIGYFANFVRTSSYGGSLTYALSPFVHVGATLSRRARAFQVDAAQPAFALTADTIDEAAVRLDYARRRIRLRLNASYQRRDADRDLYDYEAALLSASVSYFLKN